jgi:lipoprotein-anchoring transpeptidase ErfK/SrfK
MNLRSLVTALIASIGLSLPVSAQSLGPWGMWTDGAQLRGSTQDPSYLGTFKPPVELADGGGRPEIAPKAPEVVAFNTDYEAGSVVIDTAGRRLYYTLSATDAYSYPIAVGKQGFTWTGTEKVSKIVDWPDWIPPKEMLARKPGLPLRMLGGIKNPLGVKAIYLGNTLYRIHGTNDAGSIGEAASSGCFRMHNAEVVHLASLVNASTTVHVLKRLPEGILVSAPSSPKSSKGQGI